MQPNYQIVASCLGGSRMYGLEGPNSDWDERGVFLNLDPSAIIGLNRFEHHDIKDGETDFFLYEYANFLKSLQKTNTQALELLFNDKWNEIHQPMLDIIENKSVLIDTEKFFKSLCGYIQGERRLMLGERTGRLGGKRHAELEKHGYSPKNAVQLLRLTWCGKFFFETGEFPTRVDKVNPDLAKRLKEVKFSPENFLPEAINEESQVAEEEMKKAFDTRTINYQFDPYVANELIRKNYLPILQN
jgi:hypothetical protein